MWKRVHSRWQSTPCWLSARESPGLVGNSYALIADGIESTGEILSSLIVWGGLRIAMKPADANHPTEQKLGRSEFSRVRVCETLRVPLETAPLIEQAITRFLTESHT
jgi:hypothetical protein